MKKKLALITVIVMIFGVAAIAGSTDTLGMSGLWTKVQAVLTDQYLQPIIVVGMLGMAVFRAYKEHPFQGIMVGALALIIGQLDSIAQAIAGAMI
ncbi:MAG: hypothetical protein WC667_05045 [Sulfurimonas sp.]